MRGRMAIQNLMPESTAIDEHLPKPHRRKRLIPRCTHFLDIRRPLDAQHLRRIIRMHFIPQTHDALEDVQGHELHLAVSGYDTEARDPKDLGKNLFFFKQKTAY